MPTTFARFVSNDDTNPYWPRSESCNSKLPIEFSVLVFVQPHRAAVVGE